MIGGFRIEYYIRGRTLLVLDFYVESFMLGLVFTGILGFFEVIVLFSFVTLGVGIGFSFLVFVFFNMIFCFFDL